MHRDAKALREEGRVDPPNDAPSNVSGETDNTTIEPTGRRWVQDLKPLRLDPRLRGALAMHPLANLLQRCPP
jgi:hypothetical protein